MIKKLKTFTYFFTHDGSVWCDYLLNANGIRKVTMLEVADYFGFTEMLRVPGLERGRMVTDKYVIELRDLGMNLVKVFISMNDQQFKIITKDYGTPLNEKKIHAQ